MRVLCAHLVPERAAVGRPRRYRKGSPGGKLCTKTTYHIRHMARGRSRLSSVTALFTTMGQRGGIGRLARVLSKASRAGAHLCSLMCGLFFLVGLSTCFAGDVVHIHGKRQHPTEDETVRRLADFYGLTLYTV